MTPLDRWEAAQDLLAAYHDPEWLPDHEVWSAEDSLDLDAQIIRGRRWAPAPPPPDPRLRELIRDGNRDYCVEFRQSRSDRRDYPATVRDVAQRCLAAGLTPLDIANRMGVTDSVAARWNVTVRVRKVRRMLADGWAPRAIATTLGMSERTVHRIRDDAAQDDPPALFDIA